MSLVRAKHYITSAIILVLIFLYSTSSLFTEYWWFQSLGLESIFLISLKTKVLLFLLSAGTFFIFSGLNLEIASRISKTSIPSKVKLTIAGVISVIVGLFTSAQWFALLQYLNRTDFGLVDPIFAKDAAFYVFTLPILISVLSFIIFLLIVTTIMVAGSYFSKILTTKPEAPDPTGMHIKTDPFKKMLSIKNGAKLHLTVLGSLVFLVLAVKHYISQYSVMFSEQGIVVGAGYVDVNVFIPIVKILTVFAILVTISLYVWLFYISKDRQLRKKHIVVSLIIIYFLSIFVAPVVIPGIVQGLKVSPNELKLETPYIEHNIEFTRYAYNLNDVEEREMPLETTLTKETIENQSDTISNIRLLDWRPLTQTYKQTQEIRLYYDLSEIDVDRYPLKDGYSQVMLAPRELDQQQIVASAQTWVNKHLIYTHGFGIVMSPVNSVTEEGLPNYIIQDIPPRTEEDSLVVEEPRIYYGETYNPFVLVDTNTKEFDYPDGKSNKYNTYGGTGGVKLDSFFKKIMMAFRFADIKMLLSSELTSDTRIMIHRNIKDRVHTLFPFLSLDSDPYMIISEGRLYWIQDAYTITGNFPYSEKRNGLNYIRNSVKIVVDAYNGDVTAYVLDEDDALLKTYSKIFPGVFKKGFPFMDHIRYPEQLFRLQADIYSTYHMSDASVFYNKEDAWQIPSEIYGTGQKVKVEPYYIIVKLPGEKKEEFVLMTALSPLHKDNMIAWMAARSDGDNYGKLLLYQFTKDRLIYGPLQIEAKFDQDSKISQQLTLWSQQGSRVARGNLLVIPIDDSILYVEPLYLQAEQGQLPQLKRVLMSDGEKVVMEETLSDALEALFGVVEKKTAHKGDPAENANQYYKNMVEALTTQDWKRFGENFDKLGPALKKLI